MITAWFAIAVRTLATPGRLAALCMIAVVAGCSSDQTNHPTTSSVDRGPRSVERIRGSALHTAHTSRSIACEACHELVGDQYLRAKTWQCERCHANARMTLHAAAPIDSGARDCWTCHDFNSASTRLASCTTCHDKPQGSSPAIRAHDPKQPNEDCGTCHRAHKQPTLVTTKCETCHDKELVTGHDKPGIQITGCGSCHGFHENAAVASGRCTNCHRQSRARVAFTATFAGGHEKCVTCHRAHRFFKSEVIGCRTECHRNVVALAEAKVEKHRGCLGCHDNHDVRHSPQTACETCHANKIHPTHPKDRVTGARCVGCHAPHRGPNAPLAVACSSCHDKAGSDRAFHQGAASRGPECKDCHKPHEFDLKEVGLTLCLGCHGDTPFKNAKAIRTHTGHSNCVGCHGETVRHQPAGPRAACTTCHKEKAAVVRKGHANCVGCHDPHTTKQQTPCGTCHAPEASIARKDHRTCVNCHEPHGGKQARACGSCHAAEASTAPAKHQQCTNCHDQHSTLVKKQCIECHQDRATGVHAPVKGGCVNCHRAHGPDGHASPPACTSCHTALQSLHKIPNHQDCKTCHRSHGEQPYRQRATCISCHKDRTNHEPTAPLCIGCHNFRGAT